MFTLPIVKIASMIVKMVDLMVHVFMMKWVGAAIFKELKQEVMRYLLLGRSCRCMKMVAQKNAVRMVAQLEVLTVD
jgi:hypothetical protein